jgi:hypothetical protein
VGELELHGTSRSTISRRFRRATEAQLAELFGRDLSELSLLAVFIDGIRVGGHVIVVALCVDAVGQKHPFGLWEGDDALPSEHIRRVDATTGSTLPARGTTRGTAWPVTR